MERIFLKYAITICLFYLLVLIFGCEQKLDFITPKAEFDVFWKDPARNNETVLMDEPYSIDAGSGIWLVPTGEGNYFVFWPGDSLRDYLNITSASSGETPRSDGRIPVTYDFPGKYKIMMIASSYRQEDEKHEFDTLSKMITVNDTSTVK